MQIHHFIMLGVEDLNILLYMIQTSLPTKTVTARLFALIIGPKGVPYSYSWSATEGIPFSHPNRRTCRLCLSEIRPCAEKEVFL